MAAQNYLMISKETNIVENIILWDGDVNTWQPPSNTAVLMQADAPAMVWEAVIVNNIITDYVLSEEIGRADIGFTWDGAVCKTNDPKPVIPKIPT